MHLLIDIDDTLSVTSYRWTELTEKYMKSKRIPRIRGKSKDTYNLEESFGFKTQTAKQKYIGYMYDEIHFETFEPVKGAKEFIKWAQQAGHLITFVTARIPFTKEVTEAWLEKNFDLAEKPVVIYSQDVTSLFKFQLMDVMIDNCEDRCITAQEEGGHAILFTGIAVHESKRSDVNILHKAKTFEEVRKFIEEIK